MSKTYQPTNIDEIVNKLEKSILSCKTHEQLFTIQDFICRLHFERDKISFLDFDFLDSKVMAKCEELNSITLQQFSVKYDEINNPSQTT